MKLRRAERLLDLGAQLTFVTPEFYAMRFQAQCAFLAHDLGLTDQPLDQRAKSSRTNLVRKPRSQRFHFQSGREWLRAMVRRECRERKALHIFPLAAGGEAFLVAH